MKCHHFKISMAVVLLLVFFIGAESSFARHKQKKPETAEIKTSEAGSSIKNLVKKLKFGLDIEMSAGYRIDDLDWNIAGGGVNVLSELTWDDLRIHQYKGGGRLTLPLPQSSYALYIRGALSYGKIVEGENQDSDFNGNNRTLEFSRSNNDADNGDILDVSIGAGFQFKRRMVKSKWTTSFVPLIGYSYHQQNLRMTNGFQTIPVQAPIAGLNSTYDAEWKGLWAGFDLELTDGKKNSFMTSLEYHVVTYDAAANWNLRSEFAHPVSFTHEANGTGIVLNAGWSYLIRVNVSIKTTLEYQRWTTKSGIDTTFLATGQSGITPLNEVNWESKALSLGLQYRFN